MSKKMYLAEGGHNWKAVKFILVPVSSVEAGSPRNSN